MADENKVEFVTVKAAKEDGRVALYETHPDQVTDDNKTGEVFISGDGKAHTVARTPAVEQKLRDGVLVEVGKDEASKPQAAPLPQRRPGAEGVPPMGPGSGMPPVAPFPGEQRPDESRPDARPGRTRPSN